MPAIGQNGAGKTRLFNVITRIYEPAVDDVLLERRVAHRPLDGRVATTPDDAEAAAQTVTLGARVRACVAACRGEPTPAAHSERITSP